RNPATDQIERTELISMCTGAVPGVHQYRQHSTAWGDIRTALLNEACLPEPEICTAAGIGGRNFGVLRKVWRDWTDIPDDWLGDGAPMNVFPDEVRCYPEDLLYYEPLDDRCLIRPNIEPLQEKTVGMGFCAWSEDIVTGRT